MSDDSRLQQWSGIGFITEESSTTSTSSSSGDGREHSSHERLSHALNETEHHPHPHQQEQPLSYEQRLANAKAIAQKFMETKGMAGTIRTASTSSSYTVTSGTYGYHIQKRQEGDDGDEDACRMGMVGGYSYKSVRDVPWFRNKLRRALLKNFEYVHSKDAEALRLQLDIISRQEEQDKKQAAAVLEHAKKRELALNRMYGQSGIGLGSVKSVSQQSENLAVGGDGESSSSFGVYVKGLPQRMLRENENDHELSPIRQLFGAWGEIKNIKVYKESVIVSYSAEASMLAAINQFNGATLEGGNKIELSIAKRKVKVKSNQQHGNSTDNTARSQIYSGASVVEEPITSSMKEENTRSQREIVRTDVTIPQHATHPVKSQIEAPKSLHSIHSNQSQNIVDDIDVNDEVGSDVVVADNLDDFFSSL